MSRSRWMLAALLVASASALSGPSAGETPEAAPPTCDRFTLEKARLGMTRAEVEALSLGKVEVKDATDTVRLVVSRSKPRQEIHIQLVHDRVRMVELFQTKNEAAARAALADLTDRWGKPDNAEEPDQDGKPHKDKGGAWNVYAHIKFYSWKDRACQSYGAFRYDPGGLRLLLSSSPDSIRALDPGPEPKP